MRLIENLQMPQRVSEYFQDQRNLCQPHKSIWMEDHDFYHFSHYFKEGFTNKIRENY